MIVKRSGLPVTTASLVLLSRQYRFGQGPEHLFDVVDQTRVTGKDNFDNRLIFGDNLLALKAFYLAIAHA